MIAAVHITKGRSWHGAVEEFENVWHFDTPAISTEAGWDELIDAVVAQEKKIHAPQVTFLRARVHGPTNTTKADDVMQRVRDLSGSGSALTQHLMAPELAVVSSFYIGRSPAGYKVFLRKYFHSGAIVGSAAAGSDQALGTAVLQASVKNEYIAVMNALKTVTIGIGDNHLCTPSGRGLPIGSDPKVLDYVHTRQFRRGRKRKATAA